MPITVQCSGCGGKFRAPDEAAGKRVKCPKCSGVILIGSTQPARTRLHLRRWHCAEEPKTPEAVFERQEVATIVAECARAGIAVGESWRPASGHQNRGVRRIALPIRAETHFLLAAALRAQHEVNRAAQSYHKVVQLQPANIESHLDLGMLLKAIISVHLLNSAVAHLCAIRLQQHELQSAPLSDVNDRIASSTENSLEPAARSINHSGGQSRRTLWFRLCPLSNIALAGERTGCCRTCGDAIQSSADHRGNGPCHKRLP